MLSDEYLDQYIEEVKKAVSECVHQSISALDYVENLISYSPVKIRDIIDLRKEFLCESDYKKFGGYSLIGYFPEFISIQRIALFAFVIEIEYDLKVKLLRNRFEKYEINQPLFSGDTEFFNCIRRNSSDRFDLELIDTRFIENVNNSEIFSRNGFFYKIDPFLNQAIYPLCKDNFDKSPIFIRLDPTIRYSSQPLQQLNEEVLLPANPNWWKDLNIHRRNKEGSSYILYPKELTKNSYQEYWEYYISGIRRLDVIAKRNNNNNLSMMIEELSNKESNSNITIGRCIHLDTDDDIGTPFDSSIINHLDLAINVYEGETIERRYSDNLATGRKIENATFRTHLLRIENIPLKALFIFVEVFFKSTTLIRDWFKDQFSREGNKSR